MGLGKHGVTRAGWGIAIILETQEKLEKKQHVTAKKTGESHKRGVIENGQGQLPGKSSEGKVRHY